VIGSTVSFEYKNSLSELDKLQRNIEELGKNLELSRKDIFQIALAIEEVFSNIVSHGYTDKAEHLISITMWHQNDVLMVRVEDDGIPFNPCEAETPDLECPLEERQIGGLGCHLMKCVMDDIVYKRIDNRNVLIMKKTLGATRATSDLE
jgi:serine/threonine-protein kinase RsbW